jgi:CheY-like chemotaxis protein/signal transduction histidine kinase
VAELEDIGCSILVVEDNPATLKLLGLMLEAEGYRVSTASDARTALERIAGGAVDLVLQDLVLPDMDGLALLAAIRALPGGDLLPVIALSGFNTQLERARGEAHGFDETLLKPIQSADLLAVVRRHLPLPERSEPVFGTGKSILVIDDDALQLKLARLRLEHAGFSVTCASDGRSALALATAAPPDIVLCDVLMPGPDGYELCQTLRNVPALAQTPIVLVSAHYGGARDEALAREVGANALVTRTPDLQNVLSALRAALQASPFSTRQPKLPKEEHSERVIAQLQRQASANAVFAGKSSLQTAQLAILAGIADALLRTENSEAAFRDVLSACLDSGGISRGALYGIDDHDQLILKQALGFPAQASDALAHAFNCSPHVVNAARGAVVAVSACLSQAEAREVLAAAGLNAAVLVPFVEAGRCAGALLLGSNTPEIDERDLTAFARAVGAHISQALALTDSFTRLRDAAEAGRALSASLDADQTLAALARLATTRLADVCEVELFGEEPRVYTSGRVGDPTLGQRIQEARSRYPRRGELDGHDPVPEANEERSRSLQSLGLHSEIEVPLVAHGRVLGMLALARITAKRPFTAADRVAAEDLATRAAIAIDNAALYKAAQDANRAKDEFLATVSHELRTPLTAVLGWARMLRQGVPEAKREHVYAVIERNAAAQAQLIEELLDTSRIISGQMRIDLQPLELSRVIDAAVESLKPALELKNIELIRSSSEPRIQIRADAARLQQVVWNLLSNAVKFTPSGGQIEIRIEARETHVALSVADNGQGIEPEFLDFVFERFRQADGKITRSHGGLGLGLAISRHLVELHGGTIRVASEGKDRGSVFTVELPNADAAASQSPRKRDSTPTKFRDVPALANIDVLVVDDDADTRELLLEVLEGCGAHARGVASAEEALAAVARERPDVLLSDIGMPGDDGYALIRRLRTLAPQDGGTIPAGAITAYSRAEDRSLAIDAGFQLHVAKPINLTEFVAAVVSLSQMAAGSKHDLA